MPVTDKPTGTGFLIAQLGAHAAMRFASRLEEHGYTPPQAGVLRLLASSPDMSQQDLATRLGMQPSRVVAFVDELEEAGLVKRVRDDLDRRRNTVQLTAKGKRALATIGSVAAAHEADLTKALTSAERHELAGLLGRIAAEQGLTAGVHPGYRAMTRTRS